MAETVQYVLEGMIPALEDLQAHGLFSADEIRDIVKARTQHELKLKRRISKLEDFLRYLEYEISLEMLRRKRVAALPAGGKRKTLGDVSIMTHIHNIFFRALKKFKADRTLWLTFIEFCQVFGCWKVLNKVLAQAVQFHPLDEGFWVLSASFEYLHHGNAMSARALFQRGLRMLPESTRLWREYFKLELDYCGRLKLAAEQEALEKAGSEAAAPSLASPLFQGALLDVVFNEAMVAVSRKDAFELGLSMLHQLLDAPARFELCIDHVVSALRREHGQTPAARLALAERHLRGVEAAAKAGARDQAGAPNQSSVPDQSAYLAATKRVLMELMDGLGELPSADMMHTIIAFIQRVGKQVVEGRDQHDGGCDASEADELSALLAERIDQCFEYAQAEGLMNEALYVAWAEQPSAQTDKVIEAGLLAFPGSSTLFAKRLELLCLMDEHDDVDEDAFEELVESALSLCVAFKSHTALTLAPLVQLLIAGHRRDLLSASRFLAFVHKFWLLPGRPTCYELLAPVLQHLASALVYSELAPLLLTFHADAIAKATHTYELPLFLSRVLLDKAKSEGIKRASGTVDIKTLLERAALVGPSELPLWLLYLEYVLVVLRDAALGAQLYWRASRAVAPGQLAELTARYQAMQHGA